MYYESSLLTSGSNCQKHIVDTPRKRMDQVFLGHTIAVTICYVMYALSIGPCVMWRANEKLDYRVR